MEMAKKAVIAFSLLAHKDGYFWRNGWRNGWVTAGVTAGVTAVTAVRSLVAVASGEGKQARWWLPLPVQRVPPTRQATRVLGPAAA